MFDKWWSFGSTIIAPATLLSTLLFYFGYVSSRAQFRYFGLDVDTVGLSTQDYVMRSPQALLVPLLALSLGGERAFKGLSPDRWKAFANRARLPEPAVLKAVAETAKRIDARWWTLPEREVDGVRRRVCRCRRRREDEGDDAAEDQRARHPAPLPVPGRRQSVTRCARRPPEIRGLARNV